MTDGRDRVVVFRKDLLPISETFISAQMASYRRWAPILVGYRRVVGLDIDGILYRTQFDDQRASDRLRMKLDQYCALTGRQSKRLSRILAEIKPDLVHAHFGYDAILAAPSVARAGLPMVVTLHGTDILRDWSAWASGDMGFFFRFYPRTIQRLFANPRVHFLAVSEALRFQAIKRGVPEERLTVAYTGIDTKRFDTMPRFDGRDAAVDGQLMILFIGRLVAFKGCEFLIRAMAVVQKQFPECRLVVAGDGPLREALTTLAVSLGVAVEFTGAVGADAVLELLRQANLFCLPSITEADGTFEAFGMVMLEAQAAGVPVLTSARAGIEAIIPGETGYTFAERDVDALTRQLVMLLENPGERARLSAAAREHARQTFDIRICTARIEAIYDRIVSEDRSLIETGAAAVLSDPASFAGVSPDTITVHQTHRFSG